MAARKLRRARSVDWHGLVLSIACPCLGLACVLHHECDEFDVKVCEFDHDHETADSEYFVFCFVVMYVCSVIVDCDV